MNTISPLGSDGVTVVCVWVEWLMMMTMWCIRGKEYHSLGEDRGRKRLERERGGRLSVQVYHSRASMKADIISSVCDI